MVLAPIGRFSEMTRLSLRAMRISVEIGVLLPAPADPTSGYGYPGLIRADQVDAVRILPSADGPLEEIRGSRATAEERKARRWLIARGAWWG